MSDAIPYYGALFLFGGEYPSSIVSTANFRKTMVALGESLQTYHVPLLCRGFIGDSRDKNIAPPARNFDEMAVDDWSAAVHKGRFTTLELYDRQWGSNRYPAVYAAIHKLWEYTAAGFGERTRNGVENGITLAVQREVLSLGRDHLLDVFSDISRMTGAFYGFIEQATLWSQQFGSGLLREEMIDIRWHNRVYRGHQGETYPLSRFVARLYWANLFSAQHFKSRDPNSLPSWAVERIDEFTNDRFYVQFKDDPGTNPLLHQELTQYFNMVGS